MSSSPSRPNRYLYSLSNDVTTMSSEELLALMRHEAHRIEKAAYSNLLGTRSSYYIKCRTRIFDAYDELNRRGQAADPTSVWAWNIAVEYEEITARLVPNNTEPEACFDDWAGNKFVDFVSKRRSIRLWANEQPAANELVKLAHKMIDAARWAPNSGNRQPWRFSILLDSKRKDLLRGLKEEHCIRAPCLIFVGMDMRFYRGTGAASSELFLDAGAAIMNSLLCAHASGLSACWNLLTRSLITSRFINQLRFERFRRAIGIPQYIEPTGLISFGIPAYSPPPPTRTAVKDLIIP